MLKVVAVEDGLANVRAALAQEGYRVVGLDGSGLAEADAVVVNGMDDNFLQQHGRLTSAPVLSAAGRSADEILKDLAAYH